MTSKYTKQQMQRLMKRGDLTAWTEHLNGELRRSLVEHIRSPARLIVYENEKLGIARIYGQFQDPCTFHFSWSELQTGTAAQAVEVLRHVFNCLQQENKVVTESMLLIAALSQHWERLRKASRKGAALRNDAAGTRKAIEKQIRRLKEGHRDPTTLESRREIAASTGASMRYINMIVRPPGRNNP